MENISPPLSKIASVPPSPPPLLHFEGFEKIIFTRPSIRMGVWGCGGVGVCVETVYITMGINGY